MENRTTEEDRERVRHARMPAHYTDDLVDQTVSAYTAIVRGDFKADRVDPVAPVGETWSRNSPTAITAALQRSLLGPAALTRPCETCGVPAGTYCFETARGYCGTRIHRAMTLLTTS